MHHTAWYVALVLNNHSLTLNAGLTGSSDAVYVRNMAERFLEHGYRCVVFNGRGCGGAPLKTPRTFSAAASNDLKEVVDHVNALLPKVETEYLPGILIDSDQAPLVAIGSSLGSIILTKVIQHATPKRNSFE